MKIIDAHHHFWSVSSGNYSWLEMSDPEMLWGKPSDLPREYFPADLLASTGDLELVKWCMCNVVSTRNTQPMNPSGCRAWQMRPVPMVFHMPSWAMQTFQHPTLKNYCHSTANTKTCEAFARY